MLKVYKSVNALNQHYFLIPIHFNHIQCHTGYKIQCDIENPPDQFGTKIICFSGNIKQCTLKIDEQAEFENGKTFDEQRKELEAKQTNDMILSVDAFCTNAFATAGIFIIKNINRQDLARIAEITGLINPSLLRLIEWYKPEFIGTAANIVYEQDFGKGFITIAKPTVM